MAHMDSYPMNNSDYPQRQQHWPPHLLPPSLAHQAQSSFPSPPGSDHGQHYSQFFQTQAQAHVAQQQAQQQQQQQQQQTERTQGDPLNRATSSLSLNLSSLSVTSPTNLSPINGSSAVAAAGLSPATPISPSTNPFGHHHLHGVHGHAPNHGSHPHSHPHHMQSSPFSYDPNQGASGQQSPHHYDDQGPPPGSSAGYDTRRTPAPSRSSSSGGSASQLPRKRSFSANSNNSNISAGPGGAGAGGPGSLSINVNVNPPLVEEGMYDDESRDSAMELASAASYDDLEVRTAYGGSSAPSSVTGGSGAGGGGSGGNGSPIDGSGSTSGAEESFGIIGGGVGGTMNILGKPIATNNFVTKLYQ
ncbi:hypothetical protein CVT25_007202 [Psilocybe cyanescens]|uniref:Uncharacterized protein n=1 Tax=Psilocybe cyanescens TaxID=93625 RepID=A0A409X765_PSICY|nr:hypothetical protein CVT25_007202 [Psilocybe cyanescens]